jgi:hypothetical protein
MKLLVLTALLLTGCSVEVSHQTEDEEHKSRTMVAVDLNEPSPFQEPNVPDAIESASIRQSTTNINVVVPEHPPIVISEPSTAVTRIPDQSIQVMGSGNTIVLGDLHIHTHEHKHIHQSSKPVPVQVNVRVEVGDRISERERRRRMVERRISRAFSCYRD